jgi:hypothetical protein
MLINKYSRPVVDEMLANVGNQILKLQPFM